MGGFSKPANGIGDKIPIDGATPDVNIRRSFVRFYNDLNLEDERRQQELSTAIQKFRVFMKTMIEKYSIETKFTRVQLENMYDPDEIRQYWEMVKRRNRNRNRWWSVDKLITVEESNLAVLRNNYVSWKQEKDEVMRVRVIEVMKKYKFRSFDEIFQIN